VRGTGEPGVKEKKSREAEKGGVLPQRSYRREGGGKQQNGGPNYINEPAGIKNKRVEFRPGSAK